MDNKKVETEAVGRLVLSCAMKVHSALGCGLLESAYETCLAYELAKEDMAVARQVALPIVYQGVRLDAGYRLDLLVGDSVIVEVKAVEKFAPVHTAQLLSYLKLSGHKLGFLLNFNVVHMRDGIKRIVNNL
jgi:GxxExxY protein